MTTLADKIAFSKLIRLADGTPFSLDGRPWIVDEFWKPADGWKLWPRKDHEPCPVCAAQATAIIEHPNDNPTAKCVCGGLDAHPVVVTLLNLERQDGKTTAAMAYALATMFTGRNKRFGFLCASEDQGEMLLRENYLAVINANDRLRKLAIPYRLRIEIPSTKSSLEVIACSAKRATGAARTHVLADEARDIPADIFARYIQAIRAQCGYECPRGHVQIRPEDAPSAPALCSVCQCRLTPWFPRIIATSSSGILTDDPEHDWFDETIATREREPVPGCHVFRSDKSLNPKKHPAVSGAIEVSFGDVPGLSDHIESEGRNIAMHKGDDAVDRNDVIKCEDKTLSSLQECSLPCVAFLDTSMSREKTSVVITADDIERERQDKSDPWYYLFVAHLHWWELGGGKVIDEEEVWKHLNKTLPMFTGLRKIAFDVTFSPWARRLIKRALAEKVSWSKKIEQWDNHQHQNRAGRSELISRIGSKRIRLIPCEEMRSEFRGVKRAPTGSLDVWKDRSRSKKHADIIESMACCCYLAALEGLDGGRAHLRSKRAAPKTATQKVLTALEGVSIGGVRFGGDSY